MHAIDKEEEQSSSANLCEISRKEEEEENILCNDKDNLEINT